MKKTIFLSVAMAFATFGAFAQQASSTPTATPNPNPQAKSRGTADERAKMQADRINSTVQLTPEQYTKVLAVLKNFVAQKDALRANGAAGEDRKEKFKALNEQEEGQIKAILTPEQNTKLQAARKEHEGHKPE